MTTRPRSRIRILATSVAAGASTLALSGCGLWPGSAGDDVPDGPESVAGRLAGALSDHSLAGVALAEPGEADRFADLIAPLERYPVEVTASGVRRDRDQATGTLHWRWRVEGRAWSYETTARLADRGDGWVVVWDPATLVPSLGEGEQLLVRTLEAKRGDIVGSAGTALVTERPVLRYGLDRSRVRDAREPRSARRIARALGIDPVGFVDRVAASGPEAFVEGIVRREEEAREYIGRSFGSIPGALAVPDRIPLAPTREFAAPILGAVGPATAELIEDSDGALGEGDVVGLSGLQSRYDEQLRGTAGVAIRAVDDDGSARTLFRVRPRHGKPLATTLDADLQLKAERVLASVTDTDGPASAMVAIRPSTGEILAAANGPGTDGFNAATYGRYAPGSTFKIVTALALLRVGLAPGDVISCPPTTPVDGRSFENYDDYPAHGIGDVTFTTAIANSCNTALITERDRLGDGDITRAAAALGLGADHDLGFPAYFGQAPAPEGETEKAADLIGQGKILASPMAMAAVAASVQADRTVVPYLLTDTGAPTEDPADPLTPSEAAILRAMMRVVVTEGSARFLADVPGDVGAKTGTAEYGGPSSEGSLPTHAWMIATREDLAVAVFVESGESGSETAGPLLEDFLR